MLQLQLSSDQTILEYHQKNRACSVPARVLKPNCDDDNRLLTEK